MGLLKLLRDFIRYPFDKDRRGNLFHGFLEFMVRDYPAFLRRRPSVWRILLLPFLLIYHLFKGKR